MVNLTVSEARTRAGSVALMSYALELDLDRGDKEFLSTSRITFASLDAQPTFVEVAAERLQRVELNGQSLDPELLRDDRFAFEPVEGTNTLTITAVMAYSHDGEGLHRAVDPEDGRHYVYAMTFLDAAPRVFACFDQPDLKAVVTLRVKVPADWTVVGNTPATRPHGESSEGWWELSPTRPLATYFMTLVAGPYHSVVSVYDGITMGLHCRQSLAEHLDKDAEELFRLTGQCFDEYHRLFGIRYPFGEYHQVFVPEFNAGAMENPGCVTFADEMVFRAQATNAQRTDRANTVAHEMAHMWFGDLVTMKWWDDLWLNESFADYMGHRVCVDATDFTDNWLLFALNNKAWGLDADQRTSTHPIAGNGSASAHEALTNFDGISYAKGAVALRQMRNYLGDEAFLAGIVEHLKDHSYANATLADLVGAWERASGKDLADWTHAWLETAGVDTLAVQHGSPTVIERLNGSIEDVSRVHAITVTAYDADGNATSVPVVLTESKTEVAIDSSDESTFVLPDSGDETWAKIRIDPDSLDRLAAVLPKIEDPVGRAVAWGAIRDGVLDARISPDAFLDVVCLALPSETDDLVVNRVLTESTRWWGTYIQTMPRRDRLESLIVEMLNDCAPSSNRQLLVSRQLLRISTDVTVLWSWLDGHAPGGLLMDPDMRWRVLERLCVRGEAGHDEIKRQQQKDPSSQGAKAALRCTASIPTAANKAAVWETIANDREISNHDLYALCGAFWRPSQRRLTRPFVDRFFTDVPATAQFRSGWVVGTSCTLVYPRLSARDEVLELADRTLAGSGLDPFARRAISDATDDLRRLRASHLAFAAE